MTRFLLSLLIGAALLAGIPAQAFWQSRGSNYNISISSGSTYVGPADIVANPTAWYSCTRGVSAAYSTGSNKACNVRRASDNTTQDIVILANGNFDVASYNTFVGTDTSGSCTIASTTLTCTGLGTALHINDPISGAGIGQPCYLTAVGTDTAGAQTATINSSAVCGTVSVAVTVTAQVAGFVTKAYNQAGTTPCAGSTTCDALQATAGNQPQVLILCANSGALPCVLATAATIALVSATNFTPNASVTSSYSVLSNRFAGTGSPTFIRENGLNARIIGKSAAANTWQVLGGAGSISPAANDTAWHAGNILISGASTFANIDGTQTTGSTTANTTAGSPGAFTGDASTTLYESEGGFWDNLAFTTGTGGTASHLCYNQGQFYGTSEGTNCVP